MHQTGETLLNQKGLVAKKSLAALRQLCVGGKVER